MGRLILLSGPSCIGKGPLCAALFRLYPAITAHLSPLILFNDRPPRPGERDGDQYWFRPRADIQAMGQQPGFLLIHARADLQALDLNDLQHRLDSGINVFYEGTPYLPALLREKGLLEQYAALTIFLAPLSRGDILALRNAAVDLPALVTEIQHRKLTHRVTKQKGLLSLKDIEDVNQRACKAYEEMKDAWRYDHVIPLYDGEGHEHWDPPHPIGSAHQALLALAALLEQRDPPVGTVERWERELLP